MPIILTFSDRTPKESESLTDCQDYFQINEATRCFAIADGASQSFYPSIWAELLVKHFCENPEINQENWKLWLKPIQEKWLLEVKKRVEKARDENKPTWIESYNGLNAKRSATSTFVGLQFDEDIVKVAIIGDSCLFILNNEGTPLETHLLKKSINFSDRPEYFASYDKDNHFEPQFVNINLNHSITRDGKYFVLATDALSEYIFKSLEHKKDVFQDLLKVSSQKDFEDFVSLARHDSIKMKNDDVTLMILVNKSASLDEQAILDQLELGKDPEIQNPEKKSVQTSASSAAVPGETHRQKLNRLKQQRAILIGLLVPLLLFIGIDKISNRKSNQSVTQISTIPVPKFIRLPLGTTIYAEKQLQHVLITSLAASPEVLVLEEGDKWIKFQIDLYGYQSITSECSNCSNHEIEIQSGKNLRMFPGNLEADIFGQLKDNSKFEKLEFYSLEDWYKLRFVGYIGK